MLLAALLPAAHSQTQADRLAAAEREIAAAVCGAWRPGTGLTVDGNVHRGWVHSIIPGRHVLHVAGGVVAVFDQKAGTEGGWPRGGVLRPSVTVGYHKVRITVPAGTVLEWTRPDGVREPVPTTYLYPAGKSGA
jgi:hypothetical protein